MSNENVWATHPCREPREPFCTVPEGDAAQVTVGGSWSEDSGDSFEETSFPDGSHIPTYEVGYKPSNFRSSSRYGTEALSTGAPSARQNTSL